MAEKELPAANTIASSTKVQKDARERLRAGVAERSKSTILISPDEVGGDYDTSRALMTSLGGLVRPITQDDLKTFQDTIRRLGKKFKGGITATQVIDLSMPGPRKRAQEQIRSAMPISSKGGRVQFQTNAGPDSRNRHHMVTVEFMNYEACVVSPAHSNKIVGEMLRGKIKLECNCEDFRYRLRYIATKSNYAAGPWFEHSMPKLTNPMLLGVGCKHIIRVMQLIKDAATFKNFAMRMIDQGRMSVERKNQNVKLKEMREFDQLAKKEDSRKRRIRTTDEKQRQRQAQPSYQRQLAAAKAQRALKAEAAKRPAAQIITNKALQIAKMMDAFGWSKEQATAAINAASQK